MMYKFNIKIKNYEDNIFFVKASKNNGKKADKF